MKDFFKDVPFLIALLIVSLGIIGGLMNLVEVVML
jgi:hypothetical protein